MEFAELQKILRDNGVVGAGGAGFPSYKKLDRRTDTLILNCAECEPLLKLHKQLLAAHTDEILNAFRVIGETVGASRLVVAVKQSSKTAAIAVSEIIENGGIFELLLLKDVYPAGDEIVLTYEATGRIVQPGELPVSVGVTVFNVETVYNVSQALKGLPVTHKYVTVSGEVNAPVTLCVPLGTPVKELIRLAGGVKTDAPVYIAGGPMMGTITEENAPITKTTNGILVLPDNHPLVLSGRSDPGVDFRRAQAACCQCSFCTDMCPRHLLGYPIEPHKFMLYASNYASSDTNVYLDSLYCSGCGLCEIYACQQGLSPRKLLYTMRQGLKENGVTPMPFPHTAELNPLREYRLVPMARLKTRLGIEKYDRTPPLNEAIPDITAVRIPLKQHTGVPAAACVKPGERVSTGQCIGKAPENALSVNIHASITGTVLTVSESEIVIKI